MITAGDDYPLHQTADAIAFAGTDRNFYDRFFFNGYKDDLFFAIALGVYPQLNIMDAAFCISLDGMQHNLRFSKAMHLDRLGMKLGAFSLEIKKPLELTRICIEDNDSGIRATLEAHARHQAVEEPRFTRRNGARAFMDYTRLTQNITWHGTLNVKGKTIEISSWQGTRDRSWGVRPVGAADPQPNIPPLEPQFYWLWTPSNFDNHSLFFHTNDDALGGAWNRRAVLVDFEQKSQTHFDSIKSKIDYAPNTRRISGVHLALADELEAQFETKTPLFYMNGLGYTHPEWGHGTYHGEEAFAYDEIDISQAEQLLAQGAFQNLHIQALSDVQLKMKGKTLRGAGVIEQLFIGAHKPSGWA